MLLCQPRQPLDRRVQQFGVRREGDVLELYGGVDGEARQILRSNAPLSCATPQTLGQQEFAKPLAPMAQVRALVRKLVPGRIPHR